MDRHIVRRRRETYEPILWIVDSEQWPRACLRAELIERGYDPYGFITIAEALNSLSREVPEKPEALVLELRGQDLTPQVIETIQNLGIRTIVLGGNSELNVPFIRDHHWDVVLKRPFSLGTLADLVQKLVPIKK